MPSIAFLKNWTIDITKVPQYSAFRGKFNLQLDYTLLRNIMTSNKEVFTDDRKQLLLPIVNKINKQTGMLEVEHNPRYGLGRFYPNDSISPICVSRHIKHTLFSFLDWIDLDMIKGHPSMLYFIALANGIQLSTFKHYLENFDEIVETLSAFYSVDGEEPLSKDNIKELFSILVYGGGFSTWIGKLQENNIEIRCEVKHNFIIAFSDECKNIMSLVYLNNPAIVQKIKGDITDVYKLKQRTISYFCGTIENEILFLCYKILLKYGIVKPKSFALEYDGICCKRPSSDIDLNAAVIEINQTILSKTGLKVEMKWKDYSPIHIHTDIITERTQIANAAPVDAIPIAIGDTPINAIDVTPIDENMTLKNVENYDQFKEIFERDHFKCCNNSTFYKECKDELGNFKKLIQFTEKTVKVSYRQYNYEVPTKTGTRIKYYIDEWLDDNNIRVYEELACYPPPKICPDKHYNMWKPFRVQLLTDLEKDENNRVIIPDDEREYLMAGFEFILNHIRIMTGNEEGAFNYFLLWLGFTFLYPAEKSVMPHLVGSMGAGKSGLIMLFKYLLGKHKFIVSEDPSKEIWGHFNGMMANAFFVILEELSITDTIKFEGILKGLVTEPEISINEKGEKPYTITSYHKFISSSNGKTPIRTVKGDRRNFIVNSSGELIGNAPYFTLLREYTENTKIQMIFHDYIIHLPNVENFRTLPLYTTEYHKTLQQSNREEIDLFIEFYARKNESLIEIVIPTLELFHAYDAWKEQTNIITKVNYQKFTRNFTLFKLPIGCITHDKGRTCNSTKLMIPLILLHYDSEM
jgi:hypothetical protein